MGFFFLIGYIISLYTCTLNVGKYLIFFFYLDYAHLCAHEKYLKIIIFKTYGF